LIELVEAKATTAELIKSLSCVVDLHSECILLVKYILLVLVILIFVALIFILFLVIFITVSVVLVAGSEHVLVLLFRVLSESLVVIVFIFAVHFLVIGYSLGEFECSGLLLELGLIECLLGFSFGLPLLLDFIRVFEEGQRVD